MHTWMLQKTGSKKCNNKRVLQTKKYIPQPEIMTEPLPLLPLMAGPLWCYKKPAHISIIHAELYENRSPPTCS